MIIVYNLILIKSSENCDIIVEKSIKIANLMSFKCHLIEIFVELELQNHIKCSKNRMRDRRKNTKLHNTLIVSLISHCHAICVVLSSSTFVLLSIRSPQLIAQSLNLRLHVS